MMTRNRNLKIYFELLLFSFIVLLFVSTDSYLHDMFNKADSAWFFICGKAWMNGLTPYVDFSDSKGPLLFLIYGIGYLISHFNYVGVFFITCIFYSFTLFVTYLTTFIFLKNDRQSELTAMLMMVFMLNPLMHNEVRCEDFCMLFIMLSLYATCRLLYQKGSVAVTTFILGICFGATMLMKYNVSAIIGIFILFAAFDIIKYRKGLFLGIIMMISGFAAIALPFIIYFFIIGNMHDFVYEYFVRTVETTLNNRSSSNTIALLLSPANIFTIVSGTISTLMMIPLLKKYRYFPIISFIYFYLLSLQNARSYYLIVDSTFVVFGIIAFFRLANKRCSSRLSFHATATVAALLIIIAHVGIHDLRNANYGDFFTQDNDGRTEFYTYEYLMAQKPSSRVVHYGGCERIGVCSGALPACKFWAQQCGATAEMNSNQMEACRKGKADFVIVNTELPSLINRLQSWGYKKYDYSSVNYPYILMSKLTLKRPSKGFHVSNIDVLLKLNMMKKWMDKSAE
jgi:4-amino-4-deoxy-L-arabinose transferase-like glycosyltransferase